jgi:hypothetical protein
MDLDIHKRKRQLEETTEPLPKKRVVSSITITKSPRLATPLHLNQIQNASINNNSINSSPQKISTTFHNKHNSPTITSSIPSYQTPNNNQPLDPIYKSPPPLRLPYSLNTTKQCWSCKSTTHSTSKSNLCCNRKSNSPPDIDVLKLFFYKYFFEKLII